MTWDHPGNRVPGADGFAQARRPGGLPGMDHRDIDTALEMMGRAGIAATCSRTADTWTATDETGRVWQVTADEPLQATAELMEARQWGLRTWSET